MRHCLSSLFALLAWCLAAIPSPSAQLWMVEQPGCHWCERWNAEIGPAYPNSEEARRAPLRRVQLGALPEGIALAAPALYTPTFILVDAGRELGRIEGYPGEDFFWPLLKRLLDAHPEATRVQAESAQDPTEDPARDAARDAAGDAAETDS